MMLAAAVVTLEAAPVAVLRALEAAFWILLAVISLGQAQLVAPPEPPLTSLQADISVPLATLTSLQKLHQISAAYHDRLHD